MSVAESGRLPPDAHEPLELVHHHPGRLRLRAVAFRVRAGEGGALDAVLEMLQGSPGVRAVSHRPRTGSLLIEYEPGLVEANAILERVADAAGLELVVDPRDARRARPSPAAQAIGVTREVNAIAYELTGYRVDLRAAVPAALAALGVYAFVQQKGERLPRWDNLVYWSYNIFTSLHRREIDDAIHKRP